MVDMKFTTSNFQKKKKKKKNKKKEKKKKKKPNTGHTSTQK